MSLVPAEGVSGVRKGSSEVADIAYAYTRAAIKHVLASRDSICHILGGFGEPYTPRRLDPNNGGGIVQI